MFQYVIQTIIFQCLFLIIYDVFLKRETFFNWNRLYLLVTPIIAFIIPFIKLELFQNVISKEFVVGLPEIFIGDALEISPNIVFNLALQNETSSFTWESVFYIGMFIVAFLFTYKLWHILNMLLKSPKIKSGSFIIVKLLNSTSAFSFLNYIFLGDKISREEKDAILKHETIHVKQKHSWDLLYYEILKIIFWFNPLIYIFQNRLQTLHEFIADAEAIKFQNKTNYYQNLLAQVFETNKLSFVNSFFKTSLIKKRIIMLQKSKSKKINLFKYLMLFPVVLGMLILTSSMKSKVELDHTTAVSQNSSITTPLIKKINAVRHQIQRQGNISNTEEEGLELLLQIVKGKELNETYINKVNAFISRTSKSDLEQKIADVFEQIQKQGNLNNNEEKTLKALLILTSDNGFKDPFLKDAMEFVDIPFALIEEVPIFPGCESLKTNAERAKCFSQNVAMHVNRNFNIKLADSLGLKGRQRINVIFKVSNTGDITDVRSRAESVFLEAEAERVVKSLPKMLPGSMKGENVNVPYSLPIIFEVVGK